MNPFFVPILLPLSLLYGAAVWLRNKLFDTGILTSARFDIPLISVGNIAVGGTGKTPHIEYLIEILSSEFKIAVLSRGYKRRSKGFRYVETENLSHETGDEPLQIKRKYPQTIVAVDANRKRGIERLLRDHPSLDVVLLDDAFQHRRIAPSLNIVLVDCNRPFWNDFMLPAGGLRDCPSSLCRADIILISKCSPDISTEERRQLTAKLKKYGKLVYFGYFEADKPFPLLDQLATFDASHLIALSGIANPQHFTAMLAQLYPEAEIERLSFADHHNFTEKDLKLISQKTKNQTIVTTEKDSMRLRSYFYENPNSLARRIFYIPVKAQIIDASNFNQNITEHVRKNK
ncbi:MAG: tetraacyldisaccharide 4'-kinase [Prevotellaceae bacterium]|jgi:tetraacyldisaccharide 4'-kinase|nr:tetraacyldisaccharide 4'-kinase [Prevotellaceae bacterium]